MLVESTNKDSLVVNQLPDGSRVVIDPVNETVLALNATAGSAWDACSNPTTLSGVAEHMRRSLDPGTTEEVAERAILELEDKKLVSISEDSARPTRRQMLGTLSAAAALPLVVSLTMADQKAYAKATVSPAPPPPKKPTPPPPHWPF